MSELNVSNASKIIENLLKSRNFEIQLQRWLYSLSENEVDNWLNKVDLKTDSNILEKLERLKRWILNNHDNNDFQPTLIDLGGNSIIPDHNRTRYEIIQLLVSKIGQGNEQVDFNRDVSSLFVEEGRKDVNAEENLLGIENSGGNIRSAILFDEFGHEYEIPRTILNLIRVDKNRSNPIDRRSGIEYAKNKCS